MSLKYDDFAKEKGIKQPTSKKPGGIGGFLSSLLPTGGGVGGALGGAAAGASLGSVVPVIGTGIGGLIGAVLGGAGGSALGKVGENAIEGESDLGKGVGEEALLGGLTSTPITGGLKLLKGAGKAALGAEGAFKKGLQEAGASAIPKKAVGLRTKAAEELANAPGTSTQAGGVLSRLKDSGVDLRRDVAGTSKVAGSYTKEVDLLDALERNGLKGSATNQYKNIDGAIGNLSKNIDEQLTTLKRTEPRGTVISDLRTRIASEIPDDPAFTRELDRSLSRVSKNAKADIDASELFALKKDVSSRLGNAFKKIERGGNLTSKEEVDMALWRSLDDDIARIAPEVKQATLDQSKLITARPALQKSSEKTAGVPILGIRSKSLERGSQAARDIAGRAATGKGLLARASRDAATKAEQAVASGVTPVAGQSLLGAATRESVLGTRPDLTGVTPEQTDMTAADGSIPDMNAQLAGTDTSQQPVDQYELVQQGLQQAALKALASGDSKGLDNIVQVAGLLQSLAPESTKQKPMSAEASKVVSNAQSGLDSLSQLEGELQSDPGIQGRSAISSAFNPLGLTGSVLGTGGYEANRQNIIDVIARLRTGAAITNDEAGRFAQLIPQPADNQEVVAQKINMLRNQFSDVLNRTGGAGNDTQAAIGV